MKYSKQEYEDFVEKVMKPSWNYKVAKGRLEGSYPSTMKPSAIYHRLFGHAPTSKEHQDKIKGLDRMHEGFDPEEKPELPIYEVTVSHKGYRKTFTVKDATNKSHARTKGIGQYLRANNFGHTTQKTVNDLVRKGEIVIEVDIVH